VWKWLRLKTRMSSGSVFRFSFLLFLLLAPSPALSFGSDGHKIVAEIAHQNLSDEAKLWVKQVLPKGETLAWASTWADRIKRKKRYDWAKPLHYVNLPRDAVSYDKQRDCPEGDCVIAAIHRYKAVLLSSRTSLDQKREALRFLTHFIGDIHQPLHAAFKDDRGGNGVEVNWFGKQKNLHWVWDTGLITKEKIYWKTYANQLLQTIPAEDAKRWRQGASPEIWAVESLQLAKTKVYRFPSSKVLDDKYYRESRIIIERQMQKSGIRLAELLNRIAL